jgi:N-hydroxyarylamine O-acetyltransferase
MLLAVEAEGEEWIADVGFGGMGLLRPIRLRGGEVEECLGWRHRVAVEGDLNVLQAAGPTGDWVDQYAFTLEPQYPVDYEVSNHFTSTYPESIFRKMLMVQKAGECRVLLQNRRLIEQRPEGSKEAAVEGDEGLREVLGERFGLWVEEGTRFGVE